MTTATPTKPKTKPKPKNTALAELIALEEVWSAAESEAGRLGREHSEKLQRARQLMDERQRLAYREPALVTHAGEPAEPANAVAKVDEEIQALGDLADLGAQVEHARKIAERAKQDVLAHIPANFSEIVESLRPEGETIVAEVRERAKALADVADSYLGFARRIEGLRAADRTLHGLRVPGVDEGSELMRVASGYRDADLPLPTELG